MEYHQQSDYYTIILTWQYTEVLLILIITQLKVEANKNNLKCYLETTKPFNQTLSYVWKFKSYRVLVDSYKGQRVKIS